MQPLDLPSDVERTLERAFGPDVYRAALEALVIDGYRSAKLTVGEVARILGLDTSIAAQQWLAKRGVEVNYGLDDLHVDRASLSKLFSEAAPC